MAHCASASFASAEPFRHFQRTETSFSIKQRKIGSHTHFKHRCVWVRVWRTHCIRPIRQGTLAARPVRGVVSGIGSGRRSRRCRMSGRKRIYGSGMLWIHPRDIFLLLTRASPPLQRAAVARRQVARKIRQSRATTTGGKGRRKRKGNLKISKTTTTMPGKTKCWRSPKKARATYGKFLINHKSWHQSHPSISLGAFRSVLCRQSCFLCCLSLLLLILLLPLLSTVLPSAWPPLFILCCFSTKFHFQKPKIKHSSSSGLAFIFSRCCPPSHT